MVEVGGRGRLDGVFQVEGLVPTPNSGFARTIRRAGALLAGAGLAWACADDTVAPAPPTVPNRGPEAVGALPDRTVRAGETATLDVSPHFTDPDGDALAYAAESSAPAVVSVTVSGATVTLAGVARGSATVTVTARDPGGLSARQTFEATVPNRGPEAVGALPDRTVRAGETATLDVSPHFTDPDGDALVYAAESSAPAVVSVTVSGATVTLAGVARGSATVTVTARDPGGLSATQETSVTVQAPAPDLDFTGVTPVSATLAPGGSVVISFRVRNRGALASGATTIRAMRSPNPIISPRDAEIGSYSLPSLSPSQDHVVPLTISVDAGSLPGTVYIGMCVDPVTNESRTRNNCSEAARLTITAASSGLRPADGEPTLRVRAVRPPTQANASARRRNSETG